LPIYIWIRNEWHRLFSFSSDKTWWVLGPHLPVHGLF
jgi:hypothetical protein